MEGAATSSKVVVLSGSIVAMSLFSSGCETTSHKAAWSTSPVVLSELSMDTDYDVKRAVARNEHTPPAVLSKLAKESDNEMKMQLVYNHKTPPEVLRMLVEEKGSDKWIKIYAAKNPNAPVDVLEKLIQDNDHDISSAAAKNPNTPVRAIKAESERRQAAVDSKINQAMKEANSGDAIAQQNLGMLYFNYAKEGDKSVEYHREALIWFQKAADQGSKEGQYSVGFVYEEVYGNASEAYKWYKKAAAQGFKEAVYRMNAIETAIAKEDEKKKGLNTGKQLCMGCTSSTACTVSCTGCTACTASCTGCTGCTLVCTGCTGCTCTGCTSGCTGRTGRIN